MSHHLLASPQQAAANSVCFLIILHIDMNKNREKVSFKSSGQRENTHHLLNTWFRFYCCHDSRSEESEGPLGSTQTESPPLSVCVTGFAAAQRKSVSVLHANYRRPRLAITANQEELVVAAPLCNQRQQQRGNHWATTWKRTSFSSWLRP